MLMMRFLNKFATGLVLGLALVCGSCDRMITPRSAQIIKDAENKTADGNYLRAIALYESALDDSPRTADVHYRLALLYDDKMHDPLNALHHFKRYLTLAPSGPRAGEVKNFMKKDELALGTSLSGDSVVSRAEAARLKNENLTLRKELEDQRARAQAPADTKTASTNKNLARRRGLTWCATATPSLPSRGSSTNHRAAGNRFAMRTRMWWTIRGKLKAGMTLTIP